MSFDKKEYDKKWYQANKEKRKLANHKYYQKNKRKEYYKDYRKANKFNIYKLNAKQRNIEFLLTIEEFELIASNNCYYCNSNDDIGIDRINSNKPYIIDNCVACCSMCNRMKNTYSQEEFINKCKLIANLH